MQLLFSKSIPLLKQLSVLRIFLFLCFPLFVLAQAKPPPTGPQLPKRINEKKITPNSVSYTHLTLPTNDRV